MESRSSLPHWLSFTLAYLVGLGVAWLLLEQVAGTYFAPDLSPSAERRLMIMGALAPLAGLAAFQLIFGLLSGRWRGWRFWLIAPALVYAVAITSGYFMMRGYISLTEAAVILLGLPFGLGLWALRRR